MVMHIKERISADAFSSMETGSDPDILLDLSAVKFLTSKELSRLLIIAKRFGKNITLSKANDHIVETIKLFKFDEIFRLQG